MSSFSSRGDFVFAQLEPPKVRDASTGHIRQVWAHRAISVYWVDDDTLIGNWQRAAGIDGWFVGMLDVPTGQMREWDAATGAWEPFDPSSIRNSGAVYVRGGGGAWAFDYGTEVIARDGLFDGFAVCTVGDQGDIYMTTRPNSEPRSTSKMT